MKMIKKCHWEDNGEETKAHMHQNHTNDSRCNTSTLRCIDDIHHYWQHKTEDEPSCKDQWKCVLKHTEFGGWGSRVCWSKTWGSSMQTIQRPMDCQEYGIRQDRYDQRIIWGVLIEDRWGTGGLEHHTYIDKMVEQGLSRCATTLQNNSVRGLTTTRWTPKIVPVLWNERQTIEQHSRSHPLDTLPVLAQHLPRPLLALNQMTAGKTRQKTGQTKRQRWRKALRNQAEPPLPPEPTYTPILPPNFAS